LKINQFIFKKQLEKTSPWTDKIHTFSCVFQNYFQVFWKGLSCQSISMKNMSRNDVQCPFVHWSYKTWLHGAPSMQVIHFFLIISHFASCL